MFGKSSLKKALDKWVKDDGDLNDVLGSNADAPVKSEVEAVAICQALDALRADPTRSNDDLIGSPLHTLAALFQQVASKQAGEILKHDGLPRLRQSVHDALDGKDVNEDDVLFILKILAGYRQIDDVPLIAEAARKPVDPEGFMWTVVFGLFNSDHPGSAELVAALRDPLPTDFVAVAFLDMVNGLAISESLAEHPFNSESGRRLLETWLRDPNEENFSYAHSATAALPFLDETTRNALLPVAATHPEISVQMESAWAQAKSGDAAGIDQLAQFCTDARYAFTASQYLEELEAADRIPATAQDPDFQAVAEMAAWLAHPNEYGRVPDEIELLDTRSLYWPPTDDQRQLWLVRYTYHEDGEEGEIGVGMTGSVTFALFGETTADLSPEDIYALHCCWELEMDGDSRAPESRNSAAGRKLLAKKNPGFQE